MAHGLSCRAKSPTRAVAIMRALKPQPVYSTKVLIGNWVEESVKCPPNKNLYFPPKDVIDTNMKPESRQPDFRLNKLISLQGTVHSVLKHDSHEHADNYTTTNDLVYNHLPKPLCGPPLRYYKKTERTFYPQPDLLICCGNKTEWGLRKFKRHEWECTNVLDYSSTLYEDTYVAPLPHQYLPACERKAKDSKFTKSFMFKMTKSKK